MICNLSDFTEWDAEKDPELGLSLCCCHLKSLRNCWTGTACSFFTLECTHDAAVPCCPGCASSVVPFAVTFLHGTWYTDNVFASIDPTVPAPLLNLSQLCCLYTFVNNVLCMRVHLFLATGLWLLASVPLVYFSIFTPQPHCLNYSKWGDSLEQTLIISHSGLSFFFSSPVFPKGRISSLTGLNGFSHFLSKVHIFPVGTRFWLVKCYVSIWVSLTCPPARRRDSQGVEWRITAQMKGSKQ